MKKVKRWSTPSCLMVVVAALLVAHPAAASTTYAIQVGHVLSDAPGESMRFLPDRLTVHPGDVLHFSTEGLHDVVMLPANVGAQDWLDQNAAAFGDPWYFLAPNPDDETFVAKFNTHFVHSTCASPCTYDGSDVVAGGWVDLLGPNGFSVAIDAQPGDFFWIVNLAHLNMRMKVDVVDPSAQATDPGSIAATVAATLEHDEEEAAALHNKLLRKRSSHVGSDGKRVWDAWAGFDTPTFSLSAMYPAKLRIKKGDTVRWHFGSLLNEDHTVTFPQRKGVKLARSHPVLCDRSDAASGDQIHADFSQGFPPQCPAGTETEFVFSAEFVAPQGDGIHRGRRDFESSGVGGPLGTRGFAPYDVKFTKPSDNKAYKYVCMIHPDIHRGRIAVTR